MLLVSQAPIERPPCAEPIVIGLVNNMPDAALRATERQFHDLLSAASQNRVVRIRHFSLPELVRAPVAQSHISRHYEDLGELWTSRLDGLIVTGTEPRAAALEDEPYWSTLTRLVDWAAERSISTVWSCLAAHAAVLHRDNIERRRLPRKLSGVFVSIKARRDEMVADAPFQWSLPHSRYNGLIEQDLVSRGYRILYQSPATGADVFVKDEASLNIFIQGHPEYEADTLLREHRRDVGRFLAGGISEYPEVPSGYFSDDAIAALSAFRQQTLRHRDIGLLRAFPTAALERGLSSPWRLPAVRLYENWMSYLADHKTSAREHLDRSSQ